MRGAAAFGRYPYVACGAGEPHVLSMDDAGAVPLVSERTTGQPDAATFWNGRLVVPCGYQGLLVEKTPE